MTKKDMKRFFIMVLGAIFMFYVLPFLINVQPNEQISIYGTQILYLFVNIIFMAVIGWKSRDFEKYGAFVPAIIALAFLGSEFIYFGGILIDLLLNYIETAYMVYILRKLLSRVKNKQDEKNKPKPFPKSVKK